MAAWFLPRIRGGLGIATVAANAVFASFTGISIASADVFSRVAVPQMVANGYNNRFAFGGVAGTSGIAAVILVALAKGSLIWSKFWRLLVDTRLVSVSILMLIIAAPMYTRMLTLSTIPQETIQLFALMALGLMGFMMIYFLLVIIMGMILDSTLIMLILPPLCLPIVAELGGKLIWSGIVTVIAVEIGLLTPPFGLTFYVVKATIADRNTTFGDIFAGTFPVVVIMTILTLLLTFVPALILVFE